MIFYFPYVAVNFDPLNESGYINLVSERGVNCDYTDRVVEYSDTHDVRGEPQIGVRLQAGDEYMYHRPSALFQSRDAQGRPELDFS